MNGEQAVFLLGPKGSDHVRVEILARTYPRATDYWDGNWLSTHIAARAGGFRAGIAADLRTTDFTTFRRQLESLAETLNGEAVFETLEERLIIRLFGDGRGHLRARVELTDRPEVGNKLGFSISGLDQTFLPALIEQLRAIENAFPTLGSPDPSIEGAHTLVRQYYPLIQAELRRIGVSEEDERWIHAGSDHRPSEEMLVAELAKLRSLPTGLGVVGYCAHLGFDYETVKRQIPGLAPE